MIDSLTAAGIKAAYFLSLNGYLVLGIVWNLMLLAVPYYSSVLLRKAAEKEGKGGPGGGLASLRGKITGAIIFSVWLVFIPNAAYIISDVRHLASPCAADAYYNVCPETAWAIPFFFIYASIGWAAFVYLVRQMKNVLARIYGGRAAAAFPWTIMPVVSLGVLLGLLDRWNSWEIITDPVEIARHASFYFTNTVYFRDWAVFTASLYILYWAGDRLFIKAEPDPGDEDVL